MNKLTWILLALAFAFLISYEPQISAQPKISTTTTAPVQPVAAGCEQDRYHEIQFAEPAGTTCRGKPNEFLGAIM